MSFRKDFNSSMPDRPPVCEGKKVLILNGRYRGHQGVCLGPSNGRLWAVSPDESDEVLSLAFEKDFALLLDLSSNPERN